MAEATQPQNQTAAPAETEQSFAELWATAEAKANAADGDGAAPEGVEDPSADKSKGKPKSAAAKPAKTDAESDGETDDAESDGDDSAEGERVPPGERAKFRAWKTAQRKKLEADRSAFEAERRQFVERVGREAGPAIAAMKALQIEDWDAFATAAGAAAGVEIQGWNDLNKHVAKVFHSPEHKRLVALEREREQERQEREREKQERQQAEQRAAREKARNDYRGYVAESLKANESDPQLAVLSESGAFVSLLFGIHERDYAEHGEVDEADALERALEVARHEWETLNTFFGAQAASQPETPARPGPTAAKRGVKRPKSVSQSRAVEASPPGDMDDAQWKRWAAEQLRNANG